MVNQPLFPDIGVLALVPDHWGNCWQPRHHVLARLSHYFPVVWVNPAHEWYETVIRLGTVNTQNGQEAPSAGFSVYTPDFWLPVLYRPKWLSDLTFRLRLNRARGVLVRRGCRTIILYIWRPEFAPALGLVPFDVSCYHIDDEYSFSPVELPLDEAEARLIAAVDQVFIHSPALLEKKGTINPHTAFVPNGVDYQAFATPVPEPPDLAAIPHPRIGYTGILKRQLDWSLLRHLTRQHPEWSFVFIGPQGPHEEITSVIHDLSRLPNVHFLGAESTDNMAAYPQHFDVCIMPYKADDYTKYIYPLKLHEYLASGRPTVGTRIRTLEMFADVVALASTPEEWSAVLAAALDARANTPECRAARQAVARKYDWSLLVAKIARTMCHHLGQEFTDPVAEESMRWHISPLPSPP